MTYSAAYYAAWTVAVLGVIAGVLAGASQTPLAPSWLTDDVGATAGIIAGICTGLAAVLPQVQRTPGVREARYLAAMAGSPPEDVKRKAGLTVSREGDAITVTGQERPPAA